MKEMAPLSIFEQTKQAFLGRSEAFQNLLSRATLSASSFSELFELSVLRRKAQKQGLLSEKKQSLKIALLGAYTFKPLADLLEQRLYAHGFEVQLYHSDFDTYASEILNPGSGLYAFGPDVTLLLPSSQRLFPNGLRTSEQDLLHINSELLVLCAKLHEKTGSSILLGNYLPLPFHDQGALKSKLLGSDFQGKRFLNVDLANRAPSYVHICDLEFLAYRVGGFEALDERAWFQSKQLGSEKLLMELALECAQFTVRLKQATQKVLVLDLDNTLWGGVIGDDGLEGIELGDTSPRGEAFKAFQKAVLELKERGVLLAVCSKNDFDKAVEPFEKHPEMLLKKEDIVNFKASWGPKSEALRQIAAELNVGLDSLVFADDNPAEIEIVNQYVPEVKTLWLEDEPALFVRKLKECRYFDPLALSEEDLSRTGMYRAESQRKELLQSVTNMDEYLKSLQMRATIEPFRTADVQRIAQLINKSNQFNLTTKRRSEAEVSELIGNANFRHFTIRLADRFGDHGLIAVVVLEKIPNTDTAIIDTWLMSCRVLERQVEELTLNAIFSEAKKLGATRVHGEYITTKKNGLVSGLYQRFGFENMQASEARSLFSKDVQDFSKYHPPIETQGACSV